VSDEKEAFLDRWSRLKQEQAKPPVEEKREEPLPVLPPVGELKPDSDFKPFMDSRVDLETRRSALKKLFADGHFKTIDPFEPYSVDLTGEDPIPAEMLKTLNHARRLLFEEKEQVAEKVEQARDQTTEPTEKPLPEAKDVAGKQDS
jgi:hypothetical protein